MASASPEPPGAASQGRCSRGPLRPAHGSPEKTRAEDRCLGHTQRGPPAEPAGQLGQTLARPHVRAQRAQGCSGAPLSLILVFGAPETASRRSRAGSASTCEEPGGSGAAPHRPCGLTQGPACLFCVEVRGRHPAKMGGGVGWLSQDRALRARHLSLRPAGLLVERQGSPAGPCARPCV